MQREEVKQTDLLTEKPPADKAVKLKLKSRIKDQNVFVSKASLSLFIIPLNGIQRENKAVKQENCG